MPCENQRQPGQSITARKEEITAVVARLTSGLVSGRYTVTVGPQGAVAFGGLTATERSGVTDNCLYRRLLVTGSALVKAKLAQAEQRAGRQVDRQAVAVGWHTHDGAQWHRGH